MSDYANDEIEVMRELYLSIQKHNLDQDQVWRVLNWAYGALINKPPKSGDSEGLK